MNKIYYEIEIGSGNIEQNTLLILILLLHIYLPVIIMFEFSCLLAHCQSQFHLIFNHFVFCCLDKKMHEISVQLFHLTIQRKLDGCKGKTEKLYTVAFMLQFYTAKASNAAVYTAKASSMLTDRSWSVSVFLTFIIVQYIILECIVSCYVCILLLLAIHYSWVCSDLAHII